MHRDPQNSGMAFAAIDKLDDREQIRELVATYAQHIALGRGEKVADLFTDDAVFSTVLPGQVAGLPDVLRGREELRSFYSKIKLGAAFPIVHSQTVKIEDNEAIGESLLQVRLDHEGRVTHGQAHYLDRYVQDDGRWKFAERTCTFLTLTPGP